MIDCIGAVEFFADGVWNWSIRSEAILRGESDLLGSLFGVDDLAGFEPLFPNRGLPEDIDLGFQAVVSRARGSGVSLHVSWASLLELRSIPWHEQATRLDTRIYKYELLDGGDERLLGKALRYPELEQGLLEPKGAESSASPAHRQGRHVYRRRRLTRRDLLESSGFPLLMELCEVLASACGQDRVRWTVVFAV